MQIRRSYWDLICWKTVSMLRLTHFDRTPESTHCRAGHVICQIPRSLDPIELEYSGHRISAHNAGQGVHTYVCNRTNNAYFCCCFQCTCSQHFTLTALATDRIRWFPSKSQLGRYRTRCPVGFSATHYNDWCRARYSIHETLPKASVSVRFSSLVSPTASSRLQWPHINITDINN